MSETGLYCYAITRGLDPAALEGSAGIAGAPLRLVEHGGLEAVVSEVDLAEFGEEGLRRNLEDLGWLESVATTHDAVARLASEQVPTAPLRLATVFLGADSVRARLGEWHDAASRALDRIEGRGEWSVKAYVDADAQETPAAEQEPAEEMGAGRAYLLKRRAATQRREASAQAGAELAEEIHAALAGGTVLSRRLAPQDRRLTGHTGEMVLNGTYLVDASGVAAFKDLVARLASEHPRVRLEVGGPWPPYTFASLDPQ